MCIFVRHRFELKSSASHALFRRVKSTPDPDTFEKYRDTVTPPISTAILLQKNALLLAESSIYTTNLYHDTPPTCIAVLLQKHEGQGLLESPLVMDENPVVDHDGLSIDDRDNSSMALHKSLTPSLLLIANDRLKMQ